MNRALLAFAIVLSNDSAHEPAVDLEVTPFTIRGL